MKTLALGLFPVLASYLECRGGTTGVPHGYVRDDAGHPVANALVTARSQSEMCRTYSDMQGFFVCLTLAPDVYAVSAEKIGTSDAYATGVRISSDQTTFLVFRFNLLRQCPAYAGAPLTAAPFISLDVRRMQTSPQNAMPPIALPMESVTPHYGCL